MGVAARCCSTSLLVLCCRAAHALISCSYELTDNAYKVCGVGPVATVAVHCVFVLVFHYACESWYYQLVVIVFIIGRW
jgi:hypothetical protein